jgi:hypothetical protein
MLGAGVSATGASRLVLIPVNATILPRGAFAAIREGIMSDGINGLLAAGWAIVFQRPI